MFTYTIIRFLLCNLIFSARWFATLMKCFEILALCSDGYFGLSYRVAEERIDGAPLEKWLNMVVAPVELAAFIRGNT